MAYFWVFFVIVLLGAYPSRDQVVLDAVCQSEEIIPARGHITIFHKSIVKMPVKCFFEVRDVLHINDPAYGDLFPLFFVDI